MKTIKLIIQKIIPFLIPIVIPSAIVNLNALGSDLELQSGFYPTLKWVYLNRFWIIPVCLFIGNISPIIKTTKTESIVKGNVTKKLLKTLLTDIFNDDTQKTRITIFRDASWFKVFWIWLKYNLLHPIDFLRRKSKHTFPSFSAKYIIASERVGTENPNSETYFRFVKRTKRDCEGIASVVKQTNKDCLIVNLPDINEIEISNYENLPEFEKEKIDNYIKETYLQDLSSLLRLHIKARHFYATMLKDETLESKAVLVVDSIADDSPFSDEAIDKISSYIKIFSTTF